MPEQNPLEGLSASLLAQATRLVANGLIVLLLAGHFLSPTEYGVLFLAISICGLMLFLSRAGVPKSAARYVTEYRESDPGQIRAIVRVSISTIVILSISVGVGLVAFRGTIAAVLDEPALTGLLVVGFFYVLFRSLNSYLYTVFQGFNHIQKAAILSITSYVGLFVAIPVLVALGYGAFGALIGYVIGYGLGTIVGLGLLYGVLRKYASDPVEPGLRRRILEYSVPLAATNGASMLYKRVDTILIGFFIGPIAVGYYTLAKQISDFVIAPASSLGFTISPSYAEYKESGDQRGAAQIYETAFEHTVLFYVPAAAGLVLVADPFVEYVFGADYAGAVPVIQVFALYIVLDAIDNITNDGLDFLGRARHRAMIKSSTGVLNLLLNVALIPTIGVVGAAISTVVCYGTMVLVNIYLIHTELSVALDRLAHSLVVICVITVCMSAVVAALVPYAGNLIGLLAIIGLGGATWITLALASGIPNIDRLGI